MRAAVTVMAVTLLLGCAVHAPAAEADRIAELLALQPGMQVADVGAGEGEWSEDLALRVGETGHVFATEVEQDQVRDIQQRAERAELDNITVVLGDQQETGLPEGCCDAVLLRLVYHHFEDPTPMRGDLWRAMRPGSLVAVIEIRPQRYWASLPGVPDRGGHGIAPEDLIEEMTADGFEVVTQHDEWADEDDHYCVVFRRASGS